MHSLLIMGLLQTKDVSYIQNKTVYDWLLAINTTAQADYLLIA